MCTAPIQPEAGDEIRLEPLESLLRFSKSLLVVLGSLDPIPVGRAHAGYFRFRLDVTNVSVCTREFVELRPACVDSRSECRESLTLRFLDRKQRWVLVREEPGSLVPRRNEWCGLVVMQEKGFELLPGQLRRQPKAIAVPPPAGVGIGLLGDKPQDAKRLEVVRQRRGGAAVESMDVDHSGVPCANRCRQIADSGRGSCRSYACKAAK